MLHDRVQEELDMISGYGDDDEEEDDDDYENDDDDFSEDEI